MSAKKVPLEIHLGRMHNGKGMKDEFMLTVNSGVSNIQILRVMLDPNQFASLLSARPQEIEGLINLSENALKKRQYKTVDVRFPPDMSPDDLDEHLEEYAPETSDGKYTVCPGDRKKLIENWPGLSRKEKVMYEIWL